MSRTFLLTDALLRAHRPGVPLCLPPTARGSFAMRPERPRSFEIARIGAASASGFDDDTDDGEESSERATALAAPAVGVVEVRGLLSSEVSAWECGWSDGYAGEGGIVDRIRSAAYAPEIAAVVVDIMGPGGDALGLGEAAGQIAAIREGCGKPILVYARQALSADYWIAVAAAGAGGLYVSESSDVGNVGTWTAHTDYSAMNAKEGIAVEYIADPAEKVSGNPDAPLDDVARERMQRSVSEITGRFAAAVVAMRGGGISAEDLAALKADTRRGAAAVAAGLADGVATSLDDVVALAYARAAAMRPPTITTSTGAPIAPSPQPASKGQKMTFSAAVLSALGLPAGASDAKAEAEILPRLALASTVMRALGAEDAPAAAGAFEAVRRDAAEVPALRSSLAKANEAAETTARRELCEELVASKGYDPAEVWTWSVATGPNGEEIKTRKPAPAYAAPHRDANGEECGMTLGTLRAFVKRAAPRTGAAPTHRKEAATEEQIRKATPAPDAADVEAKASAAGVPLDAYKAAKIAVNNATRINSAGAGA